MATNLHRGSVQFHLVEADLGGSVFQRCTLPFGFHTRNRVLMTFSIAIHGTNVPRGVNPTLSGKIKARDSLLWIFELISADLPFVVPVSCSRPTKVKLIFGRFSEYIFEIIFDVFMSRGAYYSNYIWPVFVLANYIDVSIMVLCHSNRQC